MWWCLPILPYFLIILLCLGHLTNKKRLCLTSWERDSTINLTVAQPTKPHSKFDCFFHVVYVCLVVHSELACRLQTCIIKFQHLMLAQAISRPPSYQFILKVLLHFLFPGLFPSWCELIMPPCCVQPNLIQNSIDFSLHFMHSSCFVVLFFRSEHTPHSNY